MKRVHLRESWPDTWKYSYPYDLEEIYGEVRNYGYSYSYENRRKHTLKLLEEVLPKGASILDVAAAQGNFTLSLTELGYEVTWSDLRAELADYVRMKHEKGVVHYAPGNVFDLGFDECFDGVLITEIIEHVAHPDDFLGKIAEMVKPGGYVVMSTPNGRYFRNNLPKFSDCPDPSVFEEHQFKPNADGHIFLLWPDEIRSLATATGLELQRQMLFTNPLTAGHVKLEYALRLLPRKIVELIEQGTQLLPTGLCASVMMASAARFRRSSAVK